ncbi:MAG: hypothetical protein HZA04_05230 [Nitrospinae bacterium]|nr:hypothetical protein [Nitrospinota bacterium]
MEKTLPSEVSYCGHCRIQQKVDEKVDACVQCGKPTVTWFPLHEDETNALRKWKIKNGYLPPRRES